MKKLAVTLGFLTFSKSTKAHAFNQTDESLAGETSTLNNNTCNKNKITKISINFE